MAYEQPHLCRKPDRPALPEREWRAVDDKAELGSQTVVYVTVLERVQELAEQPPKFVTVLVGQAG